MSFGFAVVDTLSSL